MVNSPNVVNKHQNIFIREMPFQHGAIPSNATSLLQEGKKKTKDDVDYPPTETTGSLTCKLNSNSQNFK
jgi:hypothetical protein